VGSYQGRQQRKFHRHLGGLASDVAQRAGLGRLVALAWPDAIGGPQSPAMEWHRGPWCFHQRPPYDEHRSIFLPTGVKIGVNDARIDVGTALGDLLREHRRSKGWPQDHLAELSGLAVRTLRYIEAGRISQPRLSTVRLLADALQLSDSDRTSFEAAANGASSRSTDVIRASSTPCQLPADLADFTARTAAVDDIVDRLGVRRRDVTPTVVPVYCISGAGGVGKSALALHSAHLLRAAGFYPDGQLYADLRGNSDAPVHVRVVLVSWLRALGCDEPDGQDDEAQLAARMRALLAERRMLILLDDAASADQVRRLLPGHAGCAVIVTSRQRLATLGASRLVDLDVLEPSESHDLLSRLAGGHRLSSDAESTRIIIEVCGGLPLALRICGARLAARQAWPIKRLADRLTDERRRLDELRVEDLEVRASLSMSLRGLDGRQRTALSRLARLDAHTAPAWAVAALLDSTVREADDLLDALVEAHLVDIGSVDEAGQLRYEMHDLTRLFARELTCDDDEPQTRAALRRALRSWLTLAKRVSERLPVLSVDTIVGTAERWSPDIDPLDLVTEPMDWFDAERAALIAGTRQATSIGSDDIAWELVVACARYFNIRASPTEWCELCRHGRAAAARSQHPRAEGYLLRYLGVAYTELDRSSDALEALQEAGRLLRAVDDPEGEAGALEELGVNYQMTGQPSSALPCFARALQLYTESGNESGQAEIHYSLGVALMEAGDPRSRDHLTLALTTWVQAGNQFSEIMARRKLGILDLSEHRPDAAFIHIGRGLALARRLGDVVQEAYARDGYARILLGAHRVAEARMQVSPHVAVLAELGDRSGEAMLLCTLAEIDLASNELPGAFTAAQRSLELSRAIGRPTWIGRALVVLGDIMHAMARRSEAMAAWKQAYDAYACVSSAEGARLASRIAGTWPSVETEANEAAHP
jgi:tetratricopeptide (TPR) repeat protein/transcriptional regulator with XRE-family HTH domain